MKTESESVLVSMGHDGEDEPKQYGELWMHREMLFDKVRCKAFRDAIFNIVKPGMTVLDMGAGSSILSMFAAQAGAEKVYAVERTKTADLARTLIRRNNLQDQIEVLQQDVLDIELPEKVDVLVSEWMGGFGVDENLLLPLVQTRDRWLKDGGHLVPAEVTAWAAPVRDLGLEEKMAFWRSSAYGLDLSYIAELMTEEVFIARHEITDETTCAEPVKLWHTDVSKTSQGEAASDFTREMSWVADKDTVVSAFAAWFDADFGDGITLSNGPFAPKTHWGRTAFPLLHPLEWKTGSILHAKISCIPDGPNLCDNRWSIRIDDGPWQYYRGQQGCTMSVGFH